MQIEEFTSGVQIQQYKYKSFSPRTINHEWTWRDPIINTLLEKATQEISELNAFSYIVDNVDLFVSMHIRKEASKSSRIEGTQTNVEDAVKELEQISPEKRDDWQEVQNYIEAMSHALKELEEFPLSSRLIKKTHNLLMQSVRGKNKGPGEFRSSQNWIGGTNLSNAIFIPPYHEEVNSLMGDLENFLHNENINVPYLIRIAIAHYQFETIHPFQDGNGRIGRLLITLYLVSENFLNKPCLYLSDYLERNKGAYYDALTTVRSSHDLSHWIKFFLTAIIETAERGKYTFQEILKLKAETDIVIAQFGQRAENAKTLLNYLYDRPAITIKNASNLLNTTSQSSSSLIREFEKKNILKEITNNKRNKIYIFDRYLELFRD